MRCHSIFEYWPCGQDHNSNWWWDRERPEEKKCVYRQLLSNENNAVTLLAFYLVCTLRFPHTVLRFFFFLQWLNQRKGLMDGAVRKIKGRVFGAKLELGVRKLGFRLPWLGRKVVFLIERWHSKIFLISIEELLESKDLTYARYSK